MRFMTKVTIPSEKWDEAQKSGTIQGTIESAMQKLRPEAAYFSEEEGKRECIFVFNLDMPSLLKPLFPNLGASFEGRAVTNAAEFQQQFGGAEVKRRTEASDLLADIRPVPQAREPQSLHAKPGESEHSPADSDEQTKRGTWPESALEPR